MHLLADKLGLAGSLDESREVFKCRDLALKVVADERHPLTVKIEEVMTRNVVTCSADDELEKAIELMAKTNCGGSR